MPSPEAISSGANYRSRRARLTRDASLAVPDFDAEGGARRRRRRQPAADAACRHDQEARGRYLHVYAPWAALDPQDRGDHPRGDESGRRHRVADAGGAAGRAVGAIRAVGQIRAGTAQAEGPASARFRPATDFRGGRYRHRASGNPQLSATAAQPVSHPDEVPRRAPAPLRRDARPRVHDEGCLFLRSRPGRRAAQLRHDVRSVRAHLCADGPDLSSRRRRHRRHRRDALARVSSDRRRRRGPDRLVPGQQPRGQRGTGRGTAPAGRARCDEVAAYLGVPIEQTVKAVVVALDPEKGVDSAALAGPEIWMLLVRGDHELNESKAGKLPGFERGWRLASEAEIVDHFGCPPGYLGPVAPRKPVRVIADRTVARMSDFICGANEADYHLAGVNWGRDLPEPHAVADIRNVLAGDPSPDGKGRLQIQRGIEVGHVFYLGSLYSEKLGATYLDELGQTHPLQMGCYGIGVTRLLGAAIEQGHDERGIIWPDPIAPCEVVICPINYRQSTGVREQADRLYRQLCEAGVDSLLDDRGERHGAMFADAELIGVGHRITIGERGLKSNQLEYASRRALQPEMVPVADAVAFIRERINR